MGSNHSESRNGNLSEIRSNFIGVHLAFAKMRPLIFRTRLLSLNAVITSSRIGSEGDSFGVVSNELNRVVGHLERLVNETDEIFRELVNQIAQWVKVESHLRLYLRTIEIAMDRIPGKKDRQDEDNNKRPSRRDDLHQAEGRRDSGGNTVAAGDTTVALVEMLQEKQNYNNEVIMMCLAELGQLMRRFTKNLDRINWLAVRQYHYTAVSALIEAARVQEAENGLTDVALDIRTLAEDISQAENYAKDKIFTLHAQFNHEINSMRQGQISA